MDDAQVCLLAAVWTVGQSYSDDAPDAQAYFERVDGWVKDYLTLLRHVRAEDDPDA